MGRLIPNGLKRLWQRALVRHLVFWLLGFVMIYLTVMTFGSARFALQLAVFVVAPSPFAVYMHYWLFDVLFKRRKYAAYFFALIALIAVSGLLIEVVFQFFEGDPDSHSGSIFTAFFVIVVSMGFRYFKEGMKQQHRLQEAEFKQVQTELDLLRSQINPHFFFNTLNNLYSLSLDRSDRVPDVILKISELMRYVLESSQQRTVSVADELRFLENYIELEKLRVDGRADVTSEVLGDPSGLQIAPMILMPFVENGFKHGLNAMISQGYLRIVIRIESGNLAFQMENSKPSSDKRADSPGLGLRNVQRRLALLYPGRHTLIVEETDDHYRVDLSVGL